MNKDRGSEMDYFIGSRGCDFIRTELFDMCGHLDCNLTTSFLVRNAVTGTVELRIVSQGTLRNRVFLELVHLRNVGG